MKHQLCFEAFSKQHSGIASFNESGPAWASWNVYNEFIQIYIYIYIYTLYIQILNSLQDKWLSMTQLQLYAESMGPQSAMPPIPFCSRLIKRFQEFPSFHQMPTVCFWILWVIGTFLLWPTYQRWNRRGELIQKNLCFLPKKSLQTLQKLVFQRSMQA